MADLERRTADELAILRLVAAVAQAVDDRDLEAYRACFADKIRCLQRDEAGAEAWTAIPAADYAAGSIAGAARMDWTHHQVGHSVIAFNGDDASAKADVVVDMQFTSESGSVDRLTVGGRYDLEFTRLADGWRITARNLVRRYTVGDLAILEPRQGP